MTYYPAKSSVIVSPRDSFVELRTNQVVVGNTLDTHCHREWSGSAVINRLLNNSAIEHVQLDTERLSNPVTQSNGNEAVNLLINFPPLPDNRLVSRSINALDLHYKKDNVVQRDRTEDQSLTSTSCSSLVMSLPEHSSRRVVLDQGGIFGKEKSSRYSLSFGRPRIELPQIPLRTTEVVHKDRPLEKSISLPQLNLTQLILVDVKTSVTNRSFTTEDIPYGKRAKLDTGDNNSNNNQTENNDTVQLSRQYTMIRPSPEELANLYNGSTHEEVKLPNVAVPTVAEKFHELRLPKHQAEISEAEKFQKYYHLRQKSVLQLKNDLPKRSQIVGIIYKKSKNSSKEIHQKPAEASKRPKKFERLPEGNLSEDARSETSEICGVNVQPSARAPKYETTSPKPPASVREEHSQSEGSTNGKYVYKTSPNGYHYKKPGSDLTAATIINLSMSRKSSLHQQSQLAAHMKLKYKSPPQPTEDGTVNTDGKNKENQPEKGIADQNFQKRKGTALSTASSSKKSVRFEGIPGIRSKLVMKKFKKLELFNQYHPVGSESEALDEETTSNKYLPILRAPSFYKLDMKRYPSNFQQDIHRDMDTMSNTSTRSTITKLSTIQLGRSFRMDHRNREKP